MSKVIEELKKLADHWDKKRDANSATAYTMAMERWDIWGKHFPDAQIMHKNATHLLKDMICGQSANALCNIFVSNKNKQVQYELSMNQRNNIEEGSADSLLKQVQSCQGSYLVRVDLDEHSYVFFHDVDDVKSPPDASDKGLPEVDDEKSPNASDIKPSPVMCYLLQTNFSDVMPHFSLAKWMENPSFGKKRNVIEHMKELTTLLKEATKLEPTKGKFVMGFEKDDPKAREIVHYFYGPNQAPGKYVSIKGMAKSSVPPNFSFFPVNNQAALQNIKRLMDISLGNKK